MYVHGATMPIDRSWVIDLNLLAPFWPTLPATWNRARVGFHSAFLSAWPADGRIGLLSMFVFLDLSVRAADPLPIGHWMRQTRDGLVALLSFAIEHGVARALHRAGDTDNAIEPQVNLEPMGKKRAHASVANRMPQLKRILDANGSGEAVARALCGGKHGVASQNAGVLNAIYRQSSKDASRDVNRVAMSWDGSTHGGHEANVGVAMSVKTEQSVYLTSKARVRFACRRMVCPKPMQFGRIFVTGIISETVRCLWFDTDRDVSRPFEDVPRPFGE